MSTRGRGEGEGKGGSRDTGGGCGEVAGIYSDKRWRPGLRCSSRGGESLSDVEMEDRTC